MTKIASNETDPFFKRKVVFDKHLMKYRRQFWDEVSQEQRYAEMEYQAKMNRRLINNVSKWHERNHRNS